MHDFSATDPRVQITATDMQAYELTASVITKIIIDSIGKKQIANVIVASGNAIIQTLSCLSVDATDWRKVNWYLADERCVAKNNLLSNQTQIESVLNKTLGKTYGTTFAPDTQQAPEKAAADYASRIASIDMFDFCLLGMGNDGHIASLLPEHLALTSDKLCCVVTDSPNPPAERITLTLKTFSRITNRFIVTTGASKTAAVRRFIANPKTPVRLFDPIAIFADRAAYE